MSNSLLMVFDFIAAAAFFAMWFEDKQRSYLFWWGFSHALIPAVIFSAVGIQAATSSIPLLEFSYSITLSMVAVTMALGAKQYRGTSPTKKTTVIGTFITCAVVISALRYFPNNLQLVIGTGVLATSYLIAARYLWSNLASERFVAVFFILRALFAIGLFSLREYESYQQILGYASAFSAIFNAILLLVISFKKTTANLKRNLEFSNALHAITAKTRVLTTGHAISEMAVKELLKLPYWSTGTLMKVSDDRCFLESIYFEGIDENVIEPLKAPVPIEGTLSEEVLRTGKPKVWTQDAMRASSFTEMYQRVFQPYTTRRGIRLVVPVSNQQAIIGVLTLSGDKRERAYIQELEMLASVGEVVGAGIENIAHIRTLNYRASHDTLTGLNNRATLHELCENELADTDYTLMLFDLNNFKEVNDVFGHAAGDKLLIELSKRLKKTLDDLAMLFRLGGDEFVVIFPDVNGQSAEQLANGLLKLIKQPLLFDGLEFERMASIGVVETKVIGHDSHELLRCADLAMYKAKHAEEAIAYYDVAYDQYMRDRTELIADVSQGLALHEFELFYQPIIDSSNQSCTLCEALLRWHHPERGLLTAAEFISAIEKTEHITALTYRVIELAMHNLSQWHQQGLTIHIAINLSARNLHDQHLPEFLLNTSKTYGVAPEYLHLEITETMLMKDPVAAEKITRQLTAAGFKISLDDFGTGYSSLAYLSRFPISTVKIDRSFVANINDDKDNRNIVEATIDLTHKLGYLVTAEGVEEANIENTLHSMGCDQLQGYMYSKAVTKAEFERWYKAR